MTSKSDESKFVDDALAILADGPIRVPIVTQIPELVPEVPGLLYWPRYISPDGQALLEASLKASTKWVGVTASEKSRRVIHYGYQYDYSHEKKLMEADKIPDHLAMITTLPHIANPDAPETHRVTAKFDQLIINEYIPGQGISPHIDDPRQFGDVIFCVSLGSGITIKFAHPDGRVVLKYVAAGSAYAMMGDSRYVWRHSIDAKKSDVVNDVPRIVARGTRYSLTFRTVRK